MSESGIKITEPWIKALFGVSAKSVSIYEALKAGAPGATSVTPAAPDGAEAEEVDPDLYRYPIFPDGNASVARIIGQSPYSQRGVRRCRREYCYKSC